MLRDFVDVFAVNLDRERVDERMLGANLIAGSEPIGAGSWPLVPAKDTRLCLLAPRQTAECPGSTARLAGRKWQ